MGENGATKMTSTMATWDRTDAERALGQIKASK